MSKWKFDIANIEKIEQVEIRFRENEAVILKFKKMEMVNNEMVDGVCVGRGYETFVKFSKKIFEEKNK